MLNISKVFTFLAAIFVVNKIGKISEVKAVPLLNSLTLYHEDYEGMKV
jgi:hypothetical protein